MTNRIGVALVMGSAAAIGAAFTLSSIGLAIVIGISVSLIFGLELS